MTRPIKNTGAIEVAVRYTASIIIDDEGVTYLRVTDNDYGRYFDEPIEDWVYHMDLVTGASPQFINEKAGRRYFET